MKLPAKPFLLFAVIICLVGKSNAQYYYYNPVDNLNAGLDTGFLVISAMLVFCKQLLFLKTSCSQIFRYAGWIFYAGSWLRESEKYQEHSVEGLAELL